MERVAWDDFLFVKMTEEGYNLLNAHAKKKV